MKSLDQLLDEYYKETGKVGLFTTGAYTKDFVEWIISRVGAVLDGMLGIISDGE